jgi:hypothetical protein
VFQRVMIAAACSSSNLLQAESRNRLTALCHLFRDATYRLRSLSCHWLAPSAVRRWNCPGGSCLRDGCADFTRQGMSLGWHETLQFVEPVFHDDDV